MNQMETGVASSSENTSLLKYDRIQRILLWLGSGFNGLFGLAFFLNPYWALSIMNSQKWSEMGVIPIEPGGIWARLDGIFLIILAILYLLASMNPGRYVGIVGICIFGKIWSVFFYVTYVFISGAGPGFLIPAAADLFLFFAHAWALGPTRLRRVLEAWKPQTL